jgi:hypothetical protein
MCLIVSPKTHRVNKLTAGAATAFKYVLDADSIDPNDGLPIQALGHPVNTRVWRPLSLTLTPIYVNPFDSGDPERNKANLTTVVASAQRFGYIAGIQLHKIMGLE